MTACRLGFTALLVSMVGTIIYGAVFGLVALGPAGFALGALVAAVVSLVSSAVVASVYCVLGLAIIGDRVPTDEARRRSTVLGGILGPLLVIWLLVPLFREGSLLTGVFFSILAVVEGAVGGRIIWELASTRGPVLEKTVLRRAARERTSEAL